MRARLIGASVLVALMATIAGGIGQAQSSPFPRTADGKPNFTGIWQVMNSANWDIQAHEARQGPVIALGAAFSIQPGPGVVEGNDIPYLPAAAAKKKENGDNWLTRDPEIKCYMPGIPRATYMPYPFQIVQGQKDILFVYEYASSNRIVHMQSKSEAPVDSWMGWSNGRWEGETLAITVNGFNDQTWFDRSGNHHTEGLTVEERYTLQGENVLIYEATMTDPKTFSRPWKIRLPLYRRLEPNVQLLEFKCVEFSEELLYGDLKKK